MSFTKLFQNVRFWPLLISIIAQVYAERQTQQVCQLSCPEGHIYPSYIQGKTYVYHYQSDQATLLDYHNTNNPTVRTEAEIKLTATDKESPCLLSLTVSNWKAKYKQTNATYNYWYLREFNPGNTDHDENGIEIESFNSTKPIKFTYYDGQVQNICIPEDDPWKNNIRKAMVSLFQTIAEDLQISDSRTIVEDDILGRFHTTFTKLENGLISKVKQRREGLLKLGGSAILAEPIPIEIPDSISSSHVPELILSYQNFTDDGILQGIQCNEGQTRSHNLFWTWFHANSTLNLIRIEDSSNSDEPENVDFVLSTLQFDFNVVKASASKNLIEHFSEQIRSKLCNYVQNTVDSSSDSNSLLNFVEIMKKFIQRLSKQDLERNFEFVRDKLNCEIENYKVRQMKMYLKIVAMSPPTDDTVEFMTHQILNGEASPEISESFLYKVAFMIHPSTRALTDIYKLVDSEINISKEILNLHASGLVKMYIKRFKIHPDDISNHPELNDLINLITENTVNDEALNRITKFEILNNMGIFNVESCLKIAQDEFDKLRCYSSCGGNKSNEYVQDLFLNNVMESDLRKAAYLQLWKCSYNNKQEIMEFLESPIEDKELTEFVKCHLEAAKNGSVSDELSWNPSSTEKLCTYIQQSRMIPSYVMRLETNIILGSLKVPRLITMSLDGVHIDDSRLYRFFQIEIFISDEMDAFIIIRRYGVTILIEKFSLNPLSYIDKDMDIKMTIMSFAPKIVEIWRKLSQESKIDYFNLKSVIDESVIIPVHTGLPAKTQIESNIRIVFNFFKKQFEKLSGSATATGSLSGTSSIIIGNNEIAGYQNNFMLDGKFEVNFEISDSKDQTFKFSMTFPKNSSTEENLRAFKVETGLKLRHYHFIEKTTEILRLDEALYQRKEHEVTTYSTIFENKDNCKLSRRKSTTESSISDAFSCTFQDWFLTISKHFNGDNKSIQIKVYPENADVSNTLKLNLSFTEEIEGSHQFEIEFESPIKHPYMFTNFKWNMKNQQDQKSVCFWLTVDNKTQIGAEGYILQEKWNFTEERESWSCDRRGKGGLLCKWPLCWLCGEQYKIGLKAKTPFPGWKEIILLEGEINQDFESENRVDMFLESRGVHKHLDTKLQLHFEKTSGLSQYPSIKSATSPLEEVPCKNTTYLAKMEIKNSFLGRFSLTNALSILASNKTLIFDNRNAAFIFKTFVEYGGQKPYHIWNSRIARTDWENFKPKDKNGNYYEYDHTRLFELSAYSSQFPMMSYDFSIEENTTRFSISDEEDTEAILAPELKTLLNERKVLTVITMLLAAMPNYTVVVEWNRHYRSLEMSNLNFDMDLIAKLLSPELNQEFESKFNIRRNEDKLELLDVGLEIGEFLNSGLWYFKNESDVFFKGQITSDKYSQDSNHHAKKISEDTWSYQGEHSKHPSGKYKASGIFSPSDDSPVYFKEFDISIFEGDSANPLKISYKENIESKSLKYKLNALTKSTTYFESSAEITKAETKTPIKLNVYLKDVFKTELQGGPSEIKFFTKFIPRNLIANGTINLVLSPGRPTMKTIIDWENQNNPSEYGSIESETEIVLEEKKKVKSRWNYSVGKRRSEIIMMINFYFERTHQPLIYLYLTDQGQKYGIDLSAHKLVSSFSEESDPTKPRYNNGISLKCERPQLEPFYTEISVANFEKQIVLEMNPTDTENTTYCHHDLHKAKLLFSHKSNVFYVFPNLNTDFIMTSDVNHFENGTRFEGFKSALLSLDVKIKADGIQSISETKFRSESQRHFSQDENHSKNWVHQSTLENKHFKIGIDGRLDTSVEIERETIDEKNNSTKKSNDSASDIQIPSIVAQTTPLENLFSVLSTTSYPNGPVFRYSSQLNYNFYGLSEFFKEFSLKGSHNFTRVVESWLNFELGNNHSINYNDYEPISWTDKINRKTTKDLGSFELSSSKLFALETSIADNTFSKPELPMFHTKITVLYPGHRAEVTSELNHVQNSSFPNNHHFYTFLHLKSDNEKCKSGGVNVTHDFKFTEESDTHSVKTVLIAYLNSDVMNISNEIKKSETMNSTSIEHVFGFDVRSPTEIFAKLVLKSFTTSGEIEESVEFLHHDFSFSILSPKTGVEVYDEFKASFTATSSANLPQLVAIRYDISNPDDDVDDYLGNIMLLRGKIPEYECSSDLKNFHHLSSHSLEFPISLDVIDAFLKNKMYCSHIDEKECTECKDADGRFLFESKSINNNTYYRLKTEPSVIQRTSIEAAWTGDKCKAEYNAIDQKDDYNISSNLNNYCSTFLRKVNPCWTKPQGCLKKSWTLQIPQCGITCHAIFVSTLAISAISAVIFSAMYGLI